jgi:hypothetical protein
MPKTGVRRRPINISAWVTEQQFCKLGILAAAKNTSVNGILCELVDSVSVQLNLPEAMQQINAGGNVTHD